MKVGIVIPIYNEEGCIERVLGDWLNTCRGLKLEFTVFAIDDGSKDNTPAILDRLASQSSFLKVFHKENGGHGSAVLYGYRKALESDVDFVFQVDSDDQFETEDFSKLWLYHQQSPFILGQRRQRHDPFVRIVITRLLSVLILIMFGIWIRDSNIPFRLMKSQVLRELLKYVPENSFAPNIFISILAHKARIPIVIMPVMHKERDTGKISILGFKLFRVCMQCLKQLALFRRSLKDFHPQINLQNT